MIDRGTVRNM